MKTRTFKSLLFLGLITVSVYACKKVELTKIATGAWNPNLAVPLAKGEFSVYDILAKTDSNDLIVVGTDGSLALSYTTEEVVLKAADVTSLPDQNFSFNQSGVGIGVLTVPSYSGTQTYSYSETIAFSDPNGAELYEIDFKNGNLTINTSSDFQHDIKYTFTFPDLTENGTPVTRSLDLTYGGSVPQTGSVTINLNNAIMDLTNGSNGHSQINVNVDVELTGTGNPILGTESIGLAVDVQNMEFDLVQGYFGTINLFSLLDTLDIKLFNNASSGNFQLTNPSLELNFTNSFGLPAQIGFNTIKTQDTGSGTDYPLSGFPSIFTLNAPTVPGQSASSTLNLNSTNTNNFNSLISPTPKKLIYDIDGTANPAGPTINFVKDDSELSLQGTLNLPLEGFATGFMFKDTVPADADLDNEFVESAMIRVNIENGFPVEASVRIFLVDQNYNQLMELTNGTQTLIPAAPVNAAGKSISMAEQISDFTITKSQISALADMKYLIFEVNSQTFQGNQGTIVKMFEDYKFNLKLGLQVEGNVNL